MSPGRHGEPASTAHVDSYPRDALAVAAQIRGGRCCPAPAPLPACFLPLTTACAKDGRSGDRFCATCGVYWNKGQNMRIPWQSPNINSQGRDLETPRRDAAERSHSPLGVHSSVPRSRGRDSQLVGCVQSGASDTVREHTIYCRHRIKTHSRETREVRGGKRPGSGRQSALVGHSWRSRARPGRLRRGLPRHGRRSCGDGDVSRNGGGSRS